MIGTSKEIFLVHMVYMFFLPFISYIGKTSGAVKTFALMRFLAGMCSIVDRQGTLLDEGFAAAMHVTYVRPLICVDAVVPLQVRTAVETLLAVLI